MRYIELKWAKKLTNIIYIIYIYYDIAIPTLYYWEEIDAYYFTDGIAGLILLTTYLLSISIISNLNKFKVFLFWLVLKYNIIN